MRLIIFKIKFLKIKEKNLFEKAKLITSPKGLFILKI